MVYQGYSNLCNSAFALKDLIHGVLSSLGSFSAPDWHPTLSHSLLRVTDSSRNPIWHLPKSIFEPQHDSWRFLFLKILILINCFSDWWLLFSLFRIALLDSVPDRLKNGAASKKWVALQCYWCESSSLATLDALNSLPNNCIVDLFTWSFSFVLARSSMSIVCFKEWDPRTPKGLFIHKE